MGVLFADNSIETIHFYSEDLYPLGHTNRGEKISYKDFEDKFLNWDNEPGGMTT